MKIASSTVASRSAYESLSMSRKSEQLDTYENGRVVSSVSSQSETVSCVSKGTLFLSDGPSLEQELSSLGVGGLRLVTPKTNRQLLSDIEEFKLKTLRSIFDVLMRRTGKLGFQNVMENDDGSMSAMPARGLQYTRTQERYESERMDFEMKGKASTQDGRVIEFSVSLSMSREFYEHTSLSASAGVTAVDPLMIQLSGSPSLTDTKFSFDLDMDGRADQISFAGKGAGFLALDKNGDGTINDGSELFGPNTGNGFKDLAFYDADRNGWIDENDPVFDGLRVWCKDENGQDKLFALGEVGIGAIFLGYDSTEFSFKDSSNQLLGTMRSSGAFLFEDGRAGTLHQVDLAL